MYSTPSVRALATGLDIQVMPDLMLSETKLLDQLKEEVECLGETVIEANKGQGFIQGNQAILPTLQQIATFYEQIDATYQYTFEQAPSVLALKRVAAGELAMAAVNAANLPDKALAVMKNGAILPTYLVAAGMTFTLPKVLMDGWSVWDPTVSSLPRVFPLVLDDETSALILVGEVNSWLDPLILATSPQLSDWFSAYPSANPIFTTLVCCEADSDDPLVATKLILQGLNYTQAAQQEKYKSAFQEPLRWDLTTQLDRANSTFYMLDTENRIMSKALAVQQRGHSAISYRMIGESLPRDEDMFHIVRRDQPISHALAPLPSNFPGCIRDDLAVLPADVRFGLLTKRDDPACYPFTTLMSIAINLHFEGDACLLGLHALKFLKWRQVTTALGAAAQNMGAYRLADIPAIASATIAVGNLATCDGERMLITLPVVWSVNSAIAGFGHAMTGIGCILFIISAVTLFYFRHRTVLRSSSVPFLGLILFGLALLLCSVSILVTSVSPSSCSSFAWVTCLGFSIVFVPFFAKTWRIYRIFSRRQLKVVKLSNQRLMAMVTAAFVIELTVLTAWQTVAPLQPVTYMLTVGEKIHQVTHCSVKDGTGMAFVAVEAVSKGLLLAVGSLLAFSTRNVTSAFNESKAIAWSVYNVLFSGMLVGVIIYIVSAAEDSLIMLLMFLLIWVTLMTWALLFAPKFYSLWRVSEKEAVEVSIHSSLQTEKSGGFSFLSTVGMSSTLLRQYGHALEIHLGKVRKQMENLGIKWASSNTINTHNGNGKDRDKDKDKDKDREGERSTLGDNFSQLGGNPSKAGEARSMIGRPVPTARADTYAAYAAAPTNTTVSPVSLTVVSPGAPASSWTWSSTSANVNHNANTNTNGNGNCSPARARRPSNPTRPASQQFNPTMSTSTEASPSASPSPSSATAQPRIITTNVPIGYGLPLALPSSTPSSPSNKRNGQPASSVLEMASVTAAASGRNASANIPVTGNGNENVNDIGSASASTSASASASEHTTTINLPRSVSVSVESAPMSSMVSSSTDGAATTVAEALQLTPDTTANNANGHVNSASSPKAKMPRSSSSRLNVRSTATINEEVEEEEGQGQGQGQAKGKGKTK